MRHLNDQYFSGNQLKEVADPSVATDAATKGYVDGAIENFHPHDGFYFPHAVQDYDGNWYGAVVIGDQVWMAENLRATHYADGTAITHGETNSSFSTPYYYHVNGNANNDNEFGLLYNHPAVIEKTFLTGWRIPSYFNDFGSAGLIGYINKQKRYQIGTAGIYKTAKSLASTDHWSTSTMPCYIGVDTQENNKTGFNAKPAGEFSQYGGQSSFQMNGFSTMAIFASIVTSTNGPGVLELSNGSNDCLLQYGSNVNHKDAHSVRCVSNLTPLQFRDWYIRQYGSMQHHIVDYSDIENTPDSETVYVTATKTGNVYYLPKSPQELRDLFTAKKTVFVVTAADGRVFYRERNSNPAFFSVSGNTAYQLYFNSNEENGVQTPWNLVSYTKGLPSYTNKAGWVLAVNSTESNVEWVPMQGGGGSAGQLSVTDDDNGNIALSLSGGSQSLVALDDDNGNITLTLN